jgi:CheY-like chemotaxis protein
VIHLLLVEDNPGWLKIVQTNLTGDDTDAGAFSVETANRLGAALELLGRGSFDVILTDLTLPDSAGLGTFHSIHSRSCLRVFVCLVGDSPRGHAPSRGCLGEWPSHASHDVNQGLIHQRWLLALQQPFSPRGPVA